MVSLVETKAVSLRKGNHSENMAFTGVQGEVVVDLGYPDKNGNLGTDVNTTLRLHDGITKSGIPMARADLLNVSSQLLAENREIVNDKNLAYADLSNLESLPSEDTSSKNKVLSTLSSYGLAIESEVQQRLDNKVNLNTDNLNTAYLTSEEIHDGQLNGNKPLAYADTSNINTRDLATPGYHSDNSTGNKPLAYSDLSNVDISGFANANLDNVSTDNLWKSVEDRSENVTGAPLARADLANVDPSVFDIQGFGFERVINKDSTINPNYVVPEHYPETVAVVDYVGNTIEKECANNYLTNINDWSSLFYKPDDVIYQYSADTSSTATGFEINQEFTTDILLLDDPKVSLYALVGSTDDSGAIQTLSLTYNIGSRDLSGIGTLYIKSLSNSTATFTITSVSNGDGTYTYSVDNILTSGSGFLPDMDYVVTNSSGQEIGEIVYKCLNVVITNVDNSGHILSIETNPKYGLTSVNETTNITPDVQIRVNSSTYSINGGPNVLKPDLTNLNGMSENDRINETGSNWRIRHDEPIPSTSQTTIPNEQDYTIATNGNVWRALKQIDISSMLGNIPSVTFKAKFIPNNSYTTDHSTLFDHSETNFSMDSYGHSTTDNYKKYLLLPNHEYNFIVYSNNSSDNYMFTTGNVGSTKIIEYSIASITFNINVQTATLNLTRNDGKSSSRQISNGTVTICISNDTNWSISKEGYSSVSGIINVANGDQTINVTLDEES